MNSQYLKKVKLPNTSGVYFFLGGKEILYIGKATSLRDRVKSYFGKDLIATRGPLLLDMVTSSSSIKWQETDSVLEALILEANLIKKYQPKYNTKEKDNKSFNYVCITKEEIPKVLVIRGRNLEGFSQGQSLRKYQAVYGPFPNGSQLKEAMRIIRRIFPYIDEQSSKRNNKIFYEQLKLTPEDLTQYKNNIKNLKLFFQGKKKSVLRNFKKEMMAYAKKKEFEKADEIKKRIFALEHINDVALIKEDITQKNHERSFLKEEQGDGEGKSFHDFRLEAYDIAHLSGKNMVGVMTVIENGEINKSEYRKFIVRTQEKSNDIGALEEVLSRRLRHTEWGLPSVIVMDGGIAQINIAKSVLNRYQFKIPVVSVVKDDRHKAKAIMGDEDIIKNYKRDILLVNSEAHRFAITFHKKRREKNFLKKSNFS
ncbi:MAG TPA: GIY-YIG nuclease family protein [Candidatus Paceibacterota bacterium]|nr:GIY-YIG nuclease family protein [Candidatus Paceibacterota bacterium]